MATHPYGTNVLVTGASSGIGLACAILFANRGYRVWAVSRSGRINGHVSESILPSSMDVTDDESVSNGIERIWNEAMETTGTGIGTVVHCAGFGIGGAAEDTPLDAVKSQMETNYFGVLRVNRALLPRMRERGPSMVVVLGSIAGRLGIPFQSHYSSSKFALEAYVESLRMEGATFNLHATIVEAGDTATGFTGNRTMAIPADSPYSDEAKRAIGKMEHDEANGYPPETVAKVVYAVANRKHPPVRIAVGLTYKMLMLLKRLLPDRFAEWVLTRMYLEK